jgi:peptide/nickel transport system permease protein
VTRRIKIVMPLAALGLLHAAILAAGFLAPHSPEAQDRDFPFAPPTRIHWVDSEGRFHLRPFVYGMTARGGGPGNYGEDKSRSYPLRFFVSGEGGADGATHPGVHLVGVERPGRLFVLGTDAFGRDQYSRMLFGGRISLFSGLLAASLALGLGLVLGALAGMHGTWLDDVIMRGTELFLALPWLYCLLILRASLPLNLSSGQLFLLLVLVIGLRGWARPARLVRGVILSAMERNYVLAARGFGASRLHLLVRHVLPESCSVLLTQAALLIPQYIMGEVTLSFLGLGVGEPVPSWGNMLSALQHYYILASYWWMWLPGFIMIPVFLAYYVLADALQEKLHVEGPIPLMETS